MTRVIFKAEDEAKSEPIGPVYIGTDPLAPRPFDPNRQPDPWITLTEARAIAATHGVTLEEV